MQTNNKRPIHRYSPRLMRILVAPLVLAWICAGSVRAPATTDTLAGDAETAASREIFNESFAERMARSVMLRDPGRYGSGDWEHEIGVVLRGFEELWHATGNREYFDYIKATIDGNVNESGEISRYEADILSVDEIKEIDLCLFLYRETGENRYRLAADLIRHQITNQPRTSAGGFWHKLRYPNQMWLGGLYMAQPFYCEYGELFGQPENFDDVAFQFREVYDHAVDAGSGLLCHGWDASKTAPWADPQTGRSPVFWTRSMGWYLMALVDVLDHFPADHPKRDDLLQILRKLSAALEAVRDPTEGVWWQVPDHPGEGNNYKESSGGLMIVYAFSKGARMGYLDVDYRRIAEESFANHIRIFLTEHPDGTFDVGGACVGTGVGDSLEYYFNRPNATNDTKGIGPFLMAGTEIELRRMEPQI